MTRPLAFWTCGYRTHDDNVIHWFMGMNRQKGVDLESNRQTAIEGARCHIDLNRRPEVSWAPIFNRPGDLLVCTVGEYNAHMFRPEFNALEPLQQDLLKTIFPEVAVALDSTDADFTKFKSVAQLQTTALLHLHRLGLTVTCSRCNGTGHHSSCERFGTTCFKCGSTPGQPGRGWVAPKITRKLIRLVKEAQVPC